MKKQFIGPKKVKNLKIAYYQEFQMRNPWDLTVLFLKLAITRKRKSIKKWKSQPYVNPDSTKLSFHKNKLEEYLDWIENKTTPIMNPTGNIPF